MDSAICNAAQVCKLQKCEEEREQRIWTLEPEKHGLRNPMSPRDGDDDTMGPCLLARPVMCQKMKHQQPVAQVWGIPKGLPVCL